MNGWTKQPGPVTGKLIEEIRKQHYFPLYAKRVLGVDIGQRRDPTALALVAVDLVGTTRLDKRNEIDELNH